MSEFLKSAKVGAITGGIAAGVLGTSHHQLKALNLHPVLNYTYGSGICLAALGSALFIVRPKDPYSTLVIAAEVWGLSGGAVAATYAFDWLESWVYRAKARGNHVQTGVYPQYNRAKKA